MPGTAAWIGLANPFDAADAITKSAELLRSLKSQFANGGRVDRKWQALDPAVIASRGANAFWQ